MADYGATHERFTLGLNQQRLLTYMAEVQTVLAQTWLTEHGLSGDILPPFPELLHFDRHAEIDWKPGKGPRNWFGRRKVSSSH